MQGEFPPGELICEEPILVVSFKIGLCRVDPRGKECRTVFQRLSFNGKTSVVRCLPLTGRTHQIRVHLQYLGFPILNDPIYGSVAWGPNRGKGGLVGKSDEELLQALVEEQRSEESLHLLDVTDDGIGIVKEADENNTSDIKDKCDGSTEPNKSQESLQADAKPRVQIMTGSNNEVDPDPEDDPGNALVQESRSTEPTGPDGNRAVSTQKTPPGARDHLCNECKLVRADPTERDLVMYLHALRYKGPDFEYATRLPDWAKEDWVEAEH